MTKRKIRKWTEADDTKLVDRWNDGARISEISEELKRTPAAVSMRLSKLRKSNGPHFIWERIKAPVTPKPKANPKPKAKPKPTTKKNEKAVVDKTKLDIGLKLYKEYTQQLERENKALLQALNAANAVIKVYSKRDED
jgi:hypothetical protein